LPPSEPIEPNHLHSFTIVRDQMIKELNSISYPENQVIMAKIVQ